MACEEVDEAEEEGHGVAHLLGPTSVNEVEAEACYESGLDNMVGRAR